MNSVHLSIERLRLRLAWVRQTEKIGKKIIFFNSLQDHRAKGPGYIYPEFELI